VRPTTRRARPSAPRETVLLVDDDPALTEALGEFFEEQGYGVVVACDGRMAAEVLRGKPPKLVLLDLRLPDCDGIELMREAQRLETPPDVIVVTGRATSQSTLAAMEAGATGYLVKPVDLARLGALTARIMERRRAAEGLVDLGRRLGQSLEPEIIGTQITDGACTLLSAQSALLALLDEESRLLVLASAGLRTLPLPAESPLGADTTAAAAAR